MSDQMAEDRGLSREERLLLKELVDSEGWGILSRVLLSHLEQCNGLALTGEGWQTIYEARGGYKNLNSFRNNVLREVELLEEELENERSESSGGSAASD